MAGFVKLRPAGLASIASGLAESVAPGDASEMVRRLRFSEVLLFETDGNSEIGLLLAAVRLRVQRLASEVEGRRCQA